jgi:hypothetical protein
MLLGNLVSGSRESGMRTRAELKSIELVGDILAKVAASGVGCSEVFSMMVTVWSMAGGL